MCFFQASTKFIKGIAEFKPSVQEELEEFKDVVKRVKLIVREAQAQFTEITPIAELKEALITQAIASGKTRE